MAPTERLSPNLFEHFKSPQLLATSRAHIAAARRRANSPTSPTTSSAHPHIGASSRRGNSCSPSPGADAHDVRVWDREQSYTGTDALTNLADHQRDSAAYIEAMWAHKAWTLVASSRMDWFQNYDGHETQWERFVLDTNGRLSRRSDDERASARPASRSLLQALPEHLRAHGFRGFGAFRAPTPSELYRSTQVGNKLTLPSGNLLSERATGCRGSRPRRPRSWGSIRSSYFLTQVNRPIAALTTNPTSSPILLTREKSRPD